MVCVPLHPSTPPPPPPPLFLMLMMRFGRGCFHDVQRVVATSPSEQLEWQNMRYFGEKRGGEGGGWRGRRLERVEREEARERELGRGTDSDSPGCSLLISHLLKQICSFLRTDMICY